MKDDRTILYLDNNEDHRELLSYLFEDAGYRILTCSSATTCLDHLVEQHISAIVMDYWIDGAEAIEISQEIKKLHPEIPFFFFTGDARIKSRENGMKIGARDYFLKPNDLGAIIPTISQFLEAAR